MDRKINRIYLSVIWLVTTVSLGIWWLFLGLSQAETISQLATALGDPYPGFSAEHLTKQSRMIWMEGTFFIALLTLGGSLLIWLSYREIQRNRLIHDFFSTVTHEMKTPLAGLRLQVEGLLEDLGETSPHTNLLKRALKESDRIESQMEKAFYLASLMRSESLFLERMHVYELKEALAEYFPQVEWKLGERSAITADKKALESIFRNLLENALKHGKATKITVQSQTQKDFTLVQISDNGKGFQGDWENFGKPFVRHSSTSGTGIGIYIVKELIQKMKGSVHFESNEKGFHIEIHLPNWKQTV